MVYVDEGIEELQKGGIRGNSFMTPTAYFFAGSDNTFTGSEIYSDIKNEFIRKDITWTKSGKNSMYTVQLSPVDATGSNIEAQGLITETGATSNVLFTTDESDIGLKSEAYAMTIEGEIIIRRPII